VTVKALCGKKRILFFVLILFFLICLGFLYRTQLWKILVCLHGNLTDRERIEAFILSFGMGGPVVFVVIQVLQVVLAPVPGEVTGFIGGYLFGAGKGFFYSSLGLSLGSYINFFIGRIIGKHYVRKIISPAKLDKLDSLVNKQGILVIFLLFVIPGFPKDYLCLFLGISPVPFKIFWILSTFGRMPGTYLLSIQGASLFDRNYFLFAVISVCCILALVAGYRYRFSDK